MSMRSLDEVVVSLVILTLLGFLALLLLWYGYNGLAAIFELLAFVYALYLVLGGAFARDEYS